MPVDGDSSAATQWSAGSRPRRLRRAEPFDIVDAVGARRGGDPFEGRDLALFGGDDQLAELRERHPVLAAIGVEPPAPVDAAGRLEAALWVIDAAVDDLAVARGGLKADRPGAFEHQHLAAGQRQGPRRGEPDDPGADHDAFDLVHIRSPLSFAGVVRGPPGRCRVEFRAPLFARGWRQVKTRDGRLGEAGRCTCGARTAAERGGWTRSAKSPTLGAAATGEGWR